MPIFKKNNVLFIALLALLGGNSPAVLAQEAETSLVNWLTIEQADSMCQIYDKPLFIDVYTDWCGWCKHMMRTTFSNPQIANLINNKFYPVRMDAESTDTTYYKGKAYGATNGKTNDLAIELMSGRLSYPTIVYVSKDDQPSPVAGYMDTRQIEPLLYFFGESANQNTSFDLFEHNFKLSFVPDSVKSVDPKEVTSGEVRWYTFAEAEALQRQNPKLLYIDIYADIYATALMMEKTTYKHPIIAQYINDNFYPVRFDAASREPIQFLGQTFVNAGEGEYSLHQLAGAFLGQQIEFPTIFFMDENQRIVNRMTYYLDPVTLEPILHYFGDKAFPNTDWNTFRQSFQSEIN